MAPNGQFLSRLIKPEWVGMQTVKAMLRRLQVEMRTVSNTRGHPCYYVAKNLDAFFPCPETFDKLSLPQAMKTDRLIYLVKISRQQNTQVVA